MPAATTNTTILDKKVAAKKALQEECGWKAEPRRAMVCIPAGMSDALGGQLLEEVMPGLLTLPLQIVVLGKGSSAYGKYFTEIASKKPHKLAIIPNENGVLEQLLLASDIALFCAPPDAEELDRCLSHGVIALSPASSHLENYDPNQEAGNAFTYDTLTPWHCFAAAVRALETYRFPYDWKTLVRHCVRVSDEEMEEDDE